MQKDYKGHANKLKDLARLTLRFATPAKLVRALRELPSLGLRIVVVKNKFAAPTPLGYSDCNLVLAVTLESGVEYLCEVQLNLQQMLEAKDEAHEPYERIRSRLPELCVGTAVDAATVEHFIMGRLNNSALDGAVAALTK
eukprot:1189530-Prymnesium_polylepis.1